MKNKLEPEMATYVEFCEAYEVALSDESVPLQRERYNEMRAKLAEPISEPLSITNESIKAKEGHEVPIRIYRSSAQENQPCCLFMHGGGFVVGNIETHHDWVAELAALSGVTIISIEYRLSPEYRYPAALNDVRDVLQALTANPTKFKIDPQRIAVSGDSAGGNLAAAICLLSRDQALAEIKAQLLIYPGLGGSRNSESYEKQADAPLLKSDELSFYARAYLGNAQADKYAMPLLESNYTNLPAAFVLTVELDPIRDDGFSYTKQLRNAGIKVEHYDAEGLVHGCMQARRTSPATRTAFDLWAEKLKTMLA